MIRIKSFLIILLSFFIIISCDGLKIPKNIFETSDRTKYEKSFSGADSLMNNWKINYSNAKNTQLKITDGYSVDVLSDSINMNALGYSVELKKGDLFIIETLKEDPESKIFVDVINGNINTEDSQSELIQNNKFTRLIKNNGHHTVIIQPEIEFKGNLQLKIYTQTSLGFPVAGKGNRDVQSFWGASRDGGGRSHEGVDIFAAKGTPIVAVSDGLVMRTDNKGLGGKQVWLRDATTENSYYYAHLDSILTQSGNRVKTGDTLGLVGNTGNAAGGATHLHFGIYTGGAEDPYPYIRKRDIPKTQKQKKFKSMMLIKSGSNLRSGAGTEYTILKNIEKSTKVKLIAVRDKWFHVKTSDGVEGFILENRLEPN